jgi:hypothetical protein
MLKKLKNFKCPKKRYIVLGVLALEIASLPAAAQIIDRVVFSVEPQASAVLIDDIDGVKRFAVASNSAFYVTAENVIGDIRVEVKNSGMIGSARFGNNAQMPGVALACSTMNLGPKTVYQAERKTAAMPGDILSQAVMVVVEHDPEADPVIRIKAGESKKPAADTVDCTSKLS